MTRSRPVPQVPVPHAGSRVIPHTPHIARTIRTLERQVKDAGKRPWQSILAVPVTPPTACTAAAMTSLFQMRTYRVGANIYVDLDVAAGTASVVSAQLYCSDLAVTGTATNTTAGGRQVIRLTLPFPASWNPGDQHWVYVQVMRVSGADATTCQVARAWQR